MSNLTVSALVDTFMGSANLAAARTTLGIASQLPVWTFDPATSGTPASGHFQTDNANPAAITQIIFNLTPKNGTFSLLNLFQAVQGEAVLVFTSFSGETYSWYNSGIKSVMAPYATFGVDNPDSDTDALSGDYAVSWVPTPTAAPPLSSVFGASGITPCADGTVTPVTSITTVQGIITAIS